MFSLKNKIPSFSYILKSSFFVFIVLIFSWGITNANDINIFSPSLDETNIDFSAVGTVSLIEKNNLILTQAQGSYSVDQTEYNLNLKHLEKIETNKYEPATIDQVLVGNKIIVQGKTDGKIYFVTRLILFKELGIIEIEETPVDISEMNSSTSTEISTTTDSNFVVETVEEIKETISNGVEIVSEVIEKIVDSVVGDQTSDDLLAPTTTIDANVGTTTDQNNDASSTEEQSLLPESDISSQDQQENLTQDLPLDNVQLEEINLNNEE